MCTEDKGITPDEFQSDALKTESYPDSRCMDLLSYPCVARLLHSVMGMQDEVGEIANAIKGHLFYGRDLDLINLKGEFGDLLWFIAVGCSAVGIDLSEAMEANRRKLKARYGEEFNKEKCDNRDIESERIALCNNETD